MSPRILPFACVRASAHSLSMHRADKEIVSRYSLCAATDTLPPLQQGVRAVSPHASLTHGCGSVCYHERGVVSRHLYTPPPPPSHPSFFPLHFAAAASSPKAECPTTLPPRPMCPPVWYSVTTRVWGGSSRPPRRSPGSLAPSLTTDPCIGHFFPLYARATSGRVFSFVCCAFQRAGSALGQGAPPFFISRFVSFFF